MRGILAAVVDAADVRAADVRAADVRAADIRSGDNALMHVGPRGTNVSFLPLQITMNGLPRSVEFHHKFGFGKVKNVRRCALWATLAGRRPA
jgi:hypothetical protein